MAASTQPHAITIRRVVREKSLHARHGLRHAAKISAADAIRNQATPRTSTRAKSKTANAGPR